MKQSSQFTLFDLMLLIVVAAFASKCLKTLWEVWQGWPEFISSSLYSYELSSQVIVTSLSWAAAAVMAALIMFFRNRWHQRKEGG